MNPRNLNKQSGTGTNGQILKSSSFFYGFFWCYVYNMLFIFNNKFGYPFKQMNADPLLLVGSIHLNLNNIPMIHLNLEHLICSGKSRGLKFPKTADANQQRPIDLGGFLSLAPLVQDKTPSSQALSKPTLSTRLASKAWKYLSRISDLALWNNDPLIHQFSFQFSTPKRRSFFGTTMASASPP